MSIINKKKEDKDNKVVIQFKITKWFDYLILFYL